MKRLMLLAVFLLAASAAQAQVFRAYLASYGNDTNPCSITAPCRLLPAALNAVQDGGEVWMLDSANFNSGTVAISKSVSILAVPGQLASIVTLAGAPALALPQANVKVALRNLLIADNANNPGVQGIYITANVTLSIEDCIFANLAYEAIYADVYNVVNTSSIHIKNTVFRNVGGIRGNIYWVAVRAGNGPTVSIMSSQFLTTGGVLGYSNMAGATTTVNVTDSYMSDGFHGVFTPTYGAGAVARSFVTRTTLHNLMYPLTAQTSPSGAGTATITVSDSASLGNYYAYWMDGAGATIRSLGNNSISDNAHSIGALTLQPLQ
jgi:hypothetical protein